MEHAVLGTLVMMLVQKPQCELTLLLILLLPTSPSGSLIICVRVRALALKRLIS